jgi:hypothetical protein
MIVFCKFQFLECISFKIKIKIKIIFQGEVRSIDERGSGGGRVTWRGASSRGARHTPTRVSSNDNMMAVVSER